MNFIESRLAENTVRLADGHRVVCAFVNDSVSKPVASYLIQNGVELIAQIRQIYDNYLFETEILAASIRHTMLIIQCAEVGADVATCPLSAITGLLKHPLTDSGLAQFLADHKKNN